MLKKILFGLIISITLISCKKEVISKEGSIDVFTNVYFNASKGLNNYRQFYISKLDYKNDTILEFVPNVNYPTIIDKVTFIKNDSFYNSVDYIESATTPFVKLAMAKPVSIFEKKFGSKWIDFPIYDYDKRIEMNDTILYGSKEFRRFKTIQGKTLTIFYVKKTDTILPYSFSKIADRDYKGRLERIDSYDKEKDIFTTLVLVPRNSVSEDGKKMFNFNYKLNSKIAEINKK